MDLGRALDAICTRAGGCNRVVVESVLALAVEIAREGQEGRAVGTLFTVGRSDAVLAHSRALILDPLAGHGPEQTHITDVQLRGTLKQLAQLDGAFVVDDDGRVVAACRYLDVSTHGVAVPLGLGSRHVAAAAVSKGLRVPAVAVSTTGLVRVFVDGEIVATLTP